MKYQAFISYSHAADGKLAPALQHACGRFGRAWYQKAAIRIFRDETNLSLSPGLWTAIEAALAQSEYFLLLCSPEAAQSKWVRQEITYWLGHSTPQKLLIVLTGGEVAWDDDAGDFDWERATLPRNLARIYPEEPLYMDLRWAHTSEHLSLTNPRFRDQTANILASLTGRSKDELIGEDVRVQRKARRIAWSASTLLLVLFLLAVGAAWWAFRERNQAVAEAKIALGRQLAAQSETLRASQGGLIDRGTLLAIEAARLAPSLESDQALRHALELLPEPGLRIPHDKQVQSMAISPDGEDLAIADNKSNTTTILRMNGRAAIGSVSSDDWMQSVAYHPAGKLLATGSSDGTLRVWDRTTLTERARLRETDGISEVVFSPDGKLMASSVFRAKGAAAEKRIAGWIRVWSFNGGEPPVLHEIATILSDAGSSWIPNGCVSLAFHPENRYLAAVCNGATMVYSFQERRNVWQANRGFSDDSVAFSPDGRYLAVGVFNEYAHVYEFKTGREIRTLGRPGEGMGRVLFTPDNAHIVTDATDGAVRVWSLETGQELRRLSAQKLMLVPDSRRIAVTRDGEIRFWDWASEPLNPRSNLSDYLADYTLSHDGRSVIAKGFGDVWITEASTGKLLEHIKYPAGSAPVVLSPDGTQVVVSQETDDMRVEQVDSSRKIRALLRRPSSGSPAALRKKGGADRTVMFSPDGRCLVTAGDEPAARIWNAQSWELERSIPLRSNFSDLEFSGDSRRLLETTEIQKTADERATRAALVWDVASGRQLAEVSLPPSTRRVGLHPAISRDGRYFAHGTAKASDNEMTFSILTPEARKVIFPAGPLKNETAPPLLSIYETAGARQLAKIELPAAVVSVVFSPDGRLVATGLEDHTARLWEVRTGRQVALMRHENLVSSVAFDPSGEYLVTASTDWTSRVWEVRGGREIARMKLDSGPYASRFTPDGKRVLTSWVNQGISLWSWRLEDLAVEACHRMTRNLTPDEWVAYLPGEPYRKTCPALASMP